MLGMVPVQVIGSVHMNEPLYASPDRPGLAIGGHQLDVTRLKEASFIGYSFSARKTDDDSSVSIILFNPFNNSTSFIQKPVDWSLNDDFIGLKCRSSLHCQNFLFYKVAGLSQQLY